MEHEKHISYDLIVIGAGITGLAAAMYAGRLKLKTLVLGENIGGTIILTDSIQNYPGFSNISGMKLAKKIKAHAKEYDIDIIEEKTEKIEPCKAGCFHVLTKKRSFHTKTIIFATGTKFRKLNIRGEKEFEGKGVSYCALCDGPLYKNKIVAVIGGGDSSAKESLLLSKYAKKIYLIMREKLRAEPINTSKVMQEKKITLLPLTEVREIKGKQFVTEILLSKPFKGSNKLKVDGIFVNIGHIPLTELAKQIKVKLNEKQEIIIDRETKTNIAGIFAAGDVTDTKFKQAITGAGEAVTAAYQAYTYVNENEFVCPYDDIG